MREIEEQEMRLREQRERHDPRIVPREGLHTIVHDSPYREEAIPPEEILDRYRHARNRKGA